MPEIGPINKTATSKVLFGRGRADYSSLYLEPVSPAAGRIGIDTGPDDRWARL